VESFITLSAKLTKLRCS